jgi:hypothetical protein
VPRPTILPRLSSDFQPNLHWQSASDLTYAANQLLLLHRTSLRVHPRRDRRGRNRSRSRRRSNLNRGRRPSHHPFCQVQLASRKRRSADGVISSTQTDPKPVPTKEQPSPTRIYTTTSQHNSRRDHQLQICKITQTRSQTLSRSKPASSGIMAPANGHETGKAASSCMRCKTRRAWW